MSFLLKSLSPDKDAVLVTIAATELIQELWESRRWTNPRVFLKAAQASLACLALQGLGEEDSTENIELQWRWGDEGLTHLYADSLFQGVVRTHYSWAGDDHENLSELKGTFKLRRSFKYDQSTGSESAYETSGIVESTGDIVNDVQDILLKSEQRDCALAVSVRWAIDESMDAPKIKITLAHAYLLHVLPPPMESQREVILSKWNSFLSMLGSPAEWELSLTPEKATQDMTSLIFASPHGMKLFSKQLSFYCSCTEEKVTSLIRLLTEDDLNHLAEQFEVSCKYCGKIYLVDKSKSGLA